MALINKIRKKSGVAILLVSVSMVLFLLGGDLLSPGSFLLGNNDNSLGSIDGTKVDRTVYQNEVDLLIQNYRIQTGQTPQEEQMGSIRNDAWTRTIFNMAYRPVLEALGLGVSKKERDDMIVGNNIHPSLKQSFSDPNTGEFKKDQLINYVNIFDQAQAPQGIDPNAFARDKAVWENFKSQLPSDRLQTKYSNLIAKSTYITKKEAEKNYKAQNTQANIRYVFVPYYSIVDSTIEVTDNMLLDYLKDNSKQYNAQDARSLKYIVFNIEPSKEDTMAVLEEMNSLKEEFATFENDTIFVKTYSDVPNAPALLSPDLLPLELQGTTKLDTGTIYGPLFVGDKFVMHKVSKVIEDTSFVANASHILIKWDSEDQKDKALAKAKAVLDSIRRGEDFSEMAMKHSTDFSNSQRGGELGWFAEGRMVKEFNDAVFDFAGTGLIAKPIETQFGYHIIKVNEPKTNIKYLVASIERTIYPSDETKDGVYSTVGQTLGDIKSVEDFNTMVDSSKTLNKFDVKNVASTETMLKGIGNARAVIQWAFNNEDTDKISDVLELDNAYVVAAVTGVQEEGNPNLDNVREEVTMKVRNQIKAKLIMEKMNGTNLDEIAKAFENTEVRNANAISLASSSISGIGFEPAGVGAVFGLEKGSVSKPIEGENGVLVIEMVAVTEPQPKDDFSIEKSTMLEGMIQKAQSFVFQAMKDLVVIEDRRYRAY